MIKRRGVLAGAAGWTIVGASAVRAQAWPSQQIKIVVPYIPGGATDTAGRIVAEKMTALLGQQVIVENRGGGNTIIGMELVAKSKPDGHTLLLGTTTLATNAALGLKQPYDPLKDFQPISTVADIPDIVAIHPSVPAKTLPEFVEWVNKQPQIVRYGTSGVGNQPHLWAELLRARLKLKMENVAYKGVADTLRDVLAGHVPIIIDVVLPTGNHVAAGRLTGLVVASAERSPICPTVPTVVELGMQDMVSAVFYGLVAPAGVPRPSSTLNGLVQQIIKDPEVIKRYATSASS
jgi:tripartite-type tricarboxylate transporter receptor subunit TctC